MTDELEQLFEQYGFVKNEYNYLISNGINVVIPDEVIASNLEKNYAFLKGLGYDDKRVKIFFKVNTKLLAQNNETIKANYNNLISYGYTEKDVYKMIKNDARIISLSDDEIVNRITDFCEIGYNYNNVLYMGKHTPQIFTDELINLKDKLAYLIDLGYTKDEVIEMTKALSSLFVYSYDNIQNKIDFLDSINAHYLPAIKPNVLMQNANVSYARLKYYEDHNIDYTRNDFKKIFIGEKQFEQQYKITKDELLNYYGKTNDKQKKY